MNLFFRLFHTGIPLEVTIAIVSIAMVVSVWLVYKHLQHPWKSFFAVWILAYLFLMLYSTVIGRTPNDSVSINLTPFWSIGAIQAGHVETFYEKIYNVLFFIPLGFLLGLYFIQYSIRRSVCIGIGTSVFIEVLQLVTRTGTCETDDVICNTLGCLMGAVLAVIAKKLYIRIIGQ